jgi:uncharacterized protein (TIGR04255 family)
MLINNPILYECISEIRYPSQFIYYNERYNVCNEIQKKLPNWKVDIGKIILNDLSNQKESRISNFVFTNKGASLNTKNLKTYENFKSLAIFVFQKVISGLNITKIDRIGIRSFLIFQSDSDFNELKDFLFGKLFNVEIKKNNIFGEITDIAYIVNSKKYNSDLRIAIGPLTKSELKTKYIYDDNNVSEASILLDIDYFNLNMSNNLNAHIKHMLKENANILEDIESNLLSYFNKGEVK